MYRDLRASAADGYTIAIIGGGPAGSSLAALLARVGMRVSVFDRDAFPRDKLCGEFLSGESHRLLQEIGCKTQIDEADPPLIHGMRFYTRTCGPLEVTLPEPALGVSRRLLDSVLVQNARSCGADVFERSEVKSLAHLGDVGVLEVIDRSGDQESERGVCADILVCAHGRFSAIDRSLKRRFVANQSPYVGFKQHHKVRSAARGAWFRTGLDRVGEMYAIEHGYCGVCPIEGDRVNVCCLVHRDLVKRESLKDWGSCVEFFSRSNETLRKRFRMIEPEDEPMQTVAQVPFTRKELSMGGVLFVGDAAGAIVPLCGDGQAMALESAVLLSQLIAHTAGEPDANMQLPKLWSRAWNARFRRRMQIGRVLQNVMLNPPAAEFAIRALGRAPRIVRMLTSATRSVPRGPVAAQRQYRL
jgi:menaquinone-9 beta-reductase